MGSQGEVIFLSHDYIALGGGKQKPKPFLYLFLSDNGDYSKTMPLLEWRMTTQEGFLSL